MIHATVAAGIMIHATVAAGMNSALLKGVRPLTLPVYHPPLASLPAPWQYYQPPVITTPGILQKLTSVAAATGLASCGQAGGHT